MMILRGKSVRCDNDRNGGARSRRAEKTQLEKENPRTEGVDEPELGSGEVGRTFEYLLRSNGLEIHYSHDQAKDDMHINSHKNSKQKTNSSFLTFHQTVCKPSEQRWTD